MVQSGCPSRYLPPWRAVYWYFTRWEEAGVTDKLMATLRIKARVWQGCQPDPSVGIIDSQARFIVTDTLGLLVAIAVLAASWTATPCTPAPRPSLNPLTSATSPSIRVGWVVERTLAWLTACRRMARDYERHPTVAEAIIRWAAIAGITAAPTRPPGNPPYLGAVLDVGASRSARARLTWT